MQRVRFESGDNALPAGGYCLFEDACDLLGWDFDELAREILRSKGLEIIGTADGRMWIPFVWILPRVSRLTDEEIVARVKALKVAHPHHGYIPYAKAAQRCGVKAYFVGALCRAGLIDCVPNNKKKNAKHRYWLARLRSLQEYLRSLAESMKSDAAAYQMGRKAAPPSVKHVLPP
jgi:hypothetical protein